VKYLLDTNVYLDALHSEQKRAQFRQTFFPLLPSTFLSAVVAYELYVNAQDNRTRGLVQEFIRPMERTGRVVSPAFDDWLEASKVIMAIAEKDGGWRSKLPALLNDVLIALCARRIGATLLTYNRKDFRLIRRHRDFSLRALVSSTSS
jgi:predicted nucleic acid-binding protein